MYIVFSVLMILAGVFMIKYPYVAWGIFEKWKSYDGTDPSDFYMLSTKIGGWVLVAIGAFFLIGLILVKVY